MAKSANAIPRVCLCGRPNVGKSSLFNRLIGRKKALVLDEPGVTRDVYRTQVEWLGRPIELADLAGLELWDEVPRAGVKKDSEKLELKRLAIEAAVSYLKTADLVLFVVDGRADLTPADEELARLVRNSGRPAIIVLSKIEGKVGEQAQIEAAALGWGDGVPTSAEHNIGIETLRERVLVELFGEEGLTPARPEPTPGEDKIDVPRQIDPESLSEVEAKAQAELQAEVSSPMPGTNRQRPIRLGVYGRPNVGKSTLVNKLLNEKRMITSPIAGTTVDTVDTDFEKDAKFYRILDTAGIRRKSKTEKGVEVLSVVRALKSIADVDVALFLIDGYEGVTDQDEKVAGELVKAGRPIVVVVNKWDICRVDKEDYAERLRKAIPFLDYAPVLFTSAERGEGIEPLWDLLDEILVQRRTQVTTGELNRFLGVVEGTNNPTGVRLYYATQISSNPPTILFMVDRPEKMHFAYERYLKNELRSRYGWMGSPLKLLFRARKHSKSKKER